MTLKISEIKNAALQKLAYLKDKNNDGILQEKEFKLFKTEAAKQQNISDEDFNQAMGLYLSNPAKSNTLSYLSGMTNDNLVKTVTADRNNKSLEISLTGNELPEESGYVLETLENSGCEVELAPNSDGKMIYRVKLSDAWASLAEKFGFTNNFTTLKEAVRALKEMAGYGSNLNASEIQGKISVSNEMAGYGSNLNASEIQGKVSVSNEMADYGSNLNTSEISGKIKYTK